MKNHYQWRVSKNATLFWFIVCYTIDGTMVFQSALNLDGLTKCRHLHLFAPQPGINGGRNISDK